MSKFEGTWHYARQTATQGTPVVKDKATITVKDGTDSTPSRVEIEAETGSPLVLSVESEKTDLDISLTGGETKGRMVILSAATPAILIGSIHQPVPPPSGGEPRGSIEDHNIDVFIAVKI